MAGTVSANDAEGSRLRLPNLAPQWSLGSSAFAALACVIVAMLVATHQPSLRITWHTDGAPGLIARVNADHAPLQSGERVRAVRQPGGEPEMLDGALILEDPDIYSAYTDYNRFLLRQARVVNVLQGPRVELIRTAGDAVTVASHAGRPFAQLPHTFWIYNLSGMACLLIAAGTWSYRRGDVAAGCFALSGIGFFGGMLCLSIYATRELALDASLFRTLSAANHLFMLLFTYSLLALFCVFPRRLCKSTRPVMAAVYAAAALVFLNETLQWYEVPGHAFYVHTFLVPYLLGVLLIVAQWRRAERRPVERAALRWLIMAVFVSLAAVIAVLIVPPIYGAPVAFSIPFATIVVLVMFCGFAFGIARYRLFDLDRWWVAAWAGFFGLLLLFGLDVLLVQALNIGPPTALALALLAVGWLYFPLRYWCWTKLVEPQQRHLEDYLPRLIDSLFAARAAGGALSRGWQALLQDLFEPLKIDACSMHLSAVVIDRHGLVLRSPTPSGDDTVELIAKRRGTRLFQAEDVKLVEAILQIARQFARLRHAEETAADEERRRIMRALHDDVSPRLLTLLHRSGSQAEASVVRAALASLKEAIFTLEHREEVALEAALGDWRAEIRERLEGLPIHLTWTRSHQTAGEVLLPWQYVNCGSCLREAVTNVLKHSGAKALAIDFAVQGRELVMTVSDDGPTCGMARLDAESGGEGMRNMRTRAHDLGGSIEWTIGGVAHGRGENGVTVRLTFPLAARPP